MRGSAEDCRTKAGPPPRQDKWMWGTRVGALDSEADPLSRM
jgi:hypothetical protein